MKQRRLTINSQAGIGRLGRAGCRRRLKGSSFLGIGGYFRAQAAHFRMPRAKLEMSRPHFEQNFSQSQRFDSCEVPICSSRTKYRACLVVLVSNVGISTSLQPAVFIPIAKTFYRGREISLSRNHEESLAPHIVLPFDLMSGVLAVLRFPFNE